LPLQDMAAEDGCHATQTDCFALNKLGDAPA